MAKGSAVSAEDGVRHGLGQPCTNLHGQPQAKHGHRVGRAGDVVETHRGPVQFETTRPSIWGRNGISSMPGIVAKHVNTK